MPWTVIYHTEFLPELHALTIEVRTELLARVNLLEMRGPQLGRPTVDRLEGSSFQNMKELRFNADGGVWRFAFAFDSKREAVVLCGGDKEGEDQEAFYDELIQIADRRFAAHLASLK